jgi:tape measure domain-containing protein
MAGQLRKEDIIQQQEIQEALAAIAKSVEPVISGFKKVADEGERLSKSVGGSDSLKNLINLSKQASKNTQQLSAAEKESIRIKKQLATTTARLNALRTEQGQRLIEEKVRLQEATRAARENAKEKMGLTQRTRGLTGAFKNLIKSIGFYAAALFGLNNIIRFFTRDLLKLTTRLDSLDFSMRTVIKTQDELAQTQLFLSDTALNYGQDILVLTERYVKFRAATQQANMSVGDTQKIFNSAAKAASVLGLRADEVNGVFLALEQMISKGKVTTEELRRQLGERLPGAFGIMADAIGVPIRELDRMLKAGEVLSAEALPKFAEALEKAYGIESVKKVNTLAAAQGRLRTSWVQFVDALNSSNVYISVIDYLNDRFANMAMLIGDGSRDLLLFSQMTGRAGVAVRTFTDTLDNFSFESLNEESKQFWTEWLDRAGFTTKQALNLWEQYYEKRRLMESEETQAITPFDIDTYKKQIDSAKKEYEDFTQIQNSSFRGVFLENASFMADATDTYKKYIGEQIKVINEKITTSEAALKKEEALTQIANYNLISAQKRGSQQEIDIARNKYQQQSKMTELALSNYQGYVDARMLLESELSGLTEDNDSFKKMQEQQKAELESLKIRQQEELRLQAKTLEDKYESETDYQNAIKSIEEANRQEQLNLQIEQQNKLLGSVKKGTMEEAKILADREKLYADLEQEITDSQMAERERGLKRFEEIMRDEKRAKEESAQEILSAAEEATHEEYLVKLKAAKDEIKNSKGNAAEIKRIDDQLTADLIANEIKILEAAIAAMDAETNAFEQASERLRRLKEQQAEEEIDRESEVEELKQDFREKTFEVGGQLLMEGFNLAGSIYDAQMQKAKQLYDLEIAMAGNSVERRIMAERKYEREKAKIMRRQAIAEKAQAALGIALNTAQAIISIWAQVPKFDFGVSAGVLTAMVTALGALQLGTVLATPIPEFAEGVENNPFDTFIAGEEGEELIFKKDGTAILTPDRPTLFSDKSFIGSDILPHDETQKWLANYAVRQSYDMIDMSDTNKYLKRIADNTGGRKREVFERNGHVYMKRGYITSRIT